MRLSSLLRRSMLLAAVAVAALASSATAQATGGISGTVTRGDDGSPFAGVIVRVVGTQITTNTNPSVKYLLQRIPTGPQTIRFTWLGYGPREFQVEITAGGMAALDAKLEPLPVQLTEIMVSGASRAPERVTEAPSAITQVDPRTLVTSSITGQAPMALRNIPG